MSDPPGESTYKRDEICFSDRDKFGDSGKTPEIGSLERNEAVFRFTHLIHPMKNTSTRMSVLTTKNRGIKNYSKKFGMRPANNNTDYSGFLIDDTGSSKKRSRKLPNHERLDFESTGASETSLGGYLNAIGTVNLLSKDQEREIGEKIRVAFGALLEHLLRSGFVLELLLHRNQAEINYKTTKLERRALLRLFEEQGTTALEHVRETYLTGGRITSEEEASIRALFLKLISELDFWQSIGFELLEELATAFSFVDNLAIQDGVEAVNHTACRTFSEVNLMEHEDCRRFLTEAFHLKARAVYERNRLIESNLRLVVAVANRIGCTMLTFDELIQEGNLGLLHAAERFDERLGNRFSTFAVNLIKSRMKRENDNQGRTIRIPVHQWEAIRRLDKVRTELEREFGREVGAFELSLKAGLEPRELDELLAIKAGVVSLHQLTASDGETLLEEVLADPDSVTPFYQKMDLTGKLDPYLMRLEETERRVICCLYGLGGMPLLSLQETSLLLGLGHAELGRVRERALVAIRDWIASIEWFYACAA